jgi:2-polyprenyl-6-methoxyphenol hydroxylase-like FAD-dependent oxidoreductase
MPKRRVSVAVIGGGIGGLSAALSLLGAGFDVSVYEQAAEISEVGAGIQVIRRELLRSAPVPGNHAPRKAARFEKTSMLSGPSMASTVPTTQEDR